MNTLIKNYIIIFLNILMCILGVIGFIYLDEPFGLYTFRYYTYCSNFLAIFEGIVFAIAVIKLVNKSEKKINSFCYLFQYIVTIALTLTMLVVFFVLIPMYGDGGLEHYVLNDIRSLGFHLFIPILSIICFVLSRHLYTMKKADIFISIFPTIVYAIIILILNIFRLVYGPYDFLKIYEQPIYMTIFWMIVIIGAAFLLSYIYYLINTYKKK